MGGGLGHGCLLCCLSVYLTLCLSVWDWLSVCLAGWLTVWLFYSASLCTVLAPCAVPHRVQCLIVCSVLSCTGLPPCVVFLMAVASCRCLMYCRIQCRHPCASPCESCPFMRPIALRPVSANCMRYICSPVTPQHLKLLSCYPDLAKPSLSLPSLSF